MTRFVHPGEALAERETRWSFRGPARGMILLACLLLCFESAAAQEGQAIDPPLATSPAQSPAGAEPLQPVPNGQAPAAEMPAIVEPLALDPETLPKDLSPWGMFESADWVVRSVMIGLAFASIVTWTIWLVKAFEITASRRRALADLRAIRGARDMREASEVLQDWRAAKALATAALQELALSHDLAAGGLVDGVKERIAARLPRVEAAAARRIGQGTGLLATIGATAPFVGLFGTVWGIMNAFIGISETQTTNLAVVAPGIAEALLATALGLVAAVPAVVIYNWCARAIAAYRGMLGDISAEVMRLASRDLDRGRLPEPKRQAA